MTLYVVQARGSDAAALQKARFIRQGFSWPAFFFSWLWLLFQGCWIGLLVLVLELAFIVLATMYLAFGPAVMVFLLGRIFWGLEGNNFRLKRHAAVNDVIEARDRDEAETIFFRRVLGERAS